MDTQAIYGGYAKNSLVEGYGKESMPIAKLPRDTHIFMPITYITPNYLSIFTIAIASSLTRLGNKVSLMLNDNNFIAHKYVLNNSAVMGYVSTGRYVQYVTDQMMRLVDAFGGDTKSVRIIKASDMWAKIMGDYGHFMSFYNLLGSLRVYGNEFENGEYEETYHILERPFNAYVYKNYVDLAKSDFKKPEYLILSNKNPARYQKIIDMLSNKSANVADSQVIATRRLPELQNNDTWPSCYMPQSAIRSLLKRINPKETDIKSISEIFISPTLRLLESMGRMDPTSIKPEDEDKTARFY
ncbi:MAG: hypothetical protein KGH69_00005, partial [Candidatus Micrarchaeota archaeon]|nr:hypothetical protein [Candidatus Micrarchaeota archaeon]